MAETTTVHVMRHGEVHNPTGILYGRLARLLTCPSAVWLRRKPSHARWQTTTSCSSWHPVAARTGNRRANRRHHGLEVATDPDLIESFNYFEGRRMSPGDGAWRDPRVWWMLRNPFGPSWGEPYKEIAARMTRGDRQGACEGGRTRGDRGESPTARGNAAPEAPGQRLSHDPRRRQCNLASLTSLVFDGDELIDLRYYGAGGELAVRRVIALLAVCCTLTGCSTGDDAVAQGGTFEFVAPGGQDRHLSTTRPKAGSVRAN